MNTSPLGSRPNGEKSSLNAVVGVSGSRHNAAAALTVDGHLRAFCELERVTRVRNAGLAPGTWPVEAVETVLACARGVGASDIRTYATAEEDVSAGASAPLLRLDHHEAHATAAYRLSPFSSAAVLVCDSVAAGPLSVWTASGRGLRRHDWPAQSAGLAGLYAECATLFGFSGLRAHELEALGRLDPGMDAARLDREISYEDGVVRASPHWRDAVGGWLGERPQDLEHRARVASAFQRHIGQVLLALAGDIRTQTGLAQLCLGGGLFFNTYFTTLLRQSGLFEDVFTPPNPGTAGTAAGAALGAFAPDGAEPPAPVSPFLGPEYDTEAIKQVLDNCKLSYECLTTSEVVDRAVGALERGRLVGWFQGRMEWGPRALGHRSILANPLSPYVLENLNLFLKHRPRHRAYGISVPVERAATWLDGPPVSRFMEYEYAVRDADLFRHVMPTGTRAVRAQTIAEPADDADLALYRELHERFGQATGLPVLVNTSFNGFSEPMVCSPRDAIRVFFGTGLDLLVLDRFVLTK